MNNFNLGWSLNEQGIDLSTQYICSTPIRISVNQVRHPLAFKYFELDFRGKFPLNCCHCSQDRESFFSLSTSFSIYCKKDCWTTARWLKLFGFQWLISHYSFMYWLTIEGAGTTTDSPFSIIYNLNGIMSGHPFLSSLISLSHSIEIFVIRIT